MVFNKIGKFFVMILALMVISASAFADLESAEEIAEGKKNEWKVRLEASLFAELLKHKGYRTPSEKKYKERILDYFGVDMDMMPPKNYEVNYGLSKKRRFIITSGLVSIYSPEFDFNSLSATPQQIRKHLFKQFDDEWYHDFVAYNKLLFNDNDDNFVREVFLKYDYGHVQKVVIFFNYEKNNVFYEEALRRTVAISENKEEIWQLLFYNNQAKGYRKRLLNDLYLQLGKVAIRDILSGLHQHWYFFEKGKYERELDDMVTIPTEMRDKALLHLIKLISQHQDTDNSLEDNQCLAYKKLTDFYSRDKELRARLEQNNYYDMGLTVLTDEKRIVSDSRHELLENHYITKSKGGYTAIHKAADTQSTVIARFPNNTNFIKLHTEGEWLYVKLTQEPSTEGYIHLSQLQYTDKN